MGGRSTRIASHVRHPGRETKKSGKEETKKNERRGMRGEGGSHESRRGINQIFLSILLTAKVPPARSRKPEQRPRWGLPPSSGTLEWRESQCGLPPPPARLGERERGKPLWLASGGVAGVDGVQGMPVRDKSGRLEKAWKRGRTRQEEEEEQLQEQQKRISHSLTLIFVF